MQVTTEVIHEQMAGFKWDMGAMGMEGLGMLGHRTVGIWGHVLLPLCLQVVPGNEHEGLAQKDDGE